MLTYQALTPFDFLALLSDGVGEHTENRILLSWKEFVINTLSCRFFARTNYRSRKRENRHVENFGARENCDAKNSGKLYANARDPDPPKHFGRSRVSSPARFGRRGHRDRSEIIDFRLELRSAKFAAHTLAHLHVFGATLGGEGEFAFSSLSYFLESS